jgi:cation transport ATPase
LDYRKIGDEDKVTTVNPSQGWMQTYFKKKSNQYSTKEEFNKKMEEAMVHSIPKVLFIALPFYALFLMLFYVRNKKYNYVNHLLFSIYLFSFTFILILFSTWTVSLFKLIKLDVTGWAVIIATALAIIYTYKGLRNYYQQSRTKTILKFLLLTGSCFIILIVVSILLFVYSIKTI